MFLLRKLNKQVFKLLSIALFAMTLILYPALLHPTNISQNLPEVSISQKIIQLSPTKAAQAAKPAVKSDEESGSDKSESEELNFFEMAMGSLAGLVLFIFGVTRLAEGLEDLGTERMKNLVSKFTTNRLAGVMTGGVATTLLESSSVTIIMVIAMVSAGVMTFVQSLAVVLGSNIGTAVGAQIISLNIKLYVPLLMLAGLLLLFLGRTNRQKTLGIILLGFGLMFYGLEAIDEAMKPFRDYEPFINWMEKLGSNPLLGAMVGAIFTIIIQSSSATVAIVITLASSGLIALPAGIAIMLGAEIGTCADTLLSTIGRGSAALRTGIFHLLFNLVTAALGIILAPQLAQLAQAVSGGGGVGRQVANAQMLFNILGVILVIGFLPIIANFLKRLIPDSQDDLKRRRRQQQKLEESEIGASI
jgi:phosphate:Na+ symporter